MQIISRVRVVLFVLICNGWSTLSLKTIDVCSSKDDQEEILPSDLHDGIFVTISTGEVAGETTDSRGSTCEFKMTLNETHGERTEVSFSKAAGSERSECFDLMYDDRDDSFSGEHNEVNCSTTPNRKVFFTKDFLDDVTIKIHDDVIAGSLVDAAIFIQNRRHVTVTTVKHSSGEVSLTCSHPNPFILPNLFKNDVDLTANLTGRQYTVAFGNSPNGDVAGVYDCSWTLVENDKTPSPRTSYDVNVYANETICQAYGLNGTHLTIPLTNGTSIEHHELSCSLAWSGNDGSLNLVWKDQESPYVDNGGQLKKTAMYKKVNITEHLVFECGVGEETPMDGMKPASCTVTFEPIPPEKEVEYMGGNQGGYIALAFILIIILVICVIFFILHRKKRLNKSLLVDIKNCCDCCNICATLNQCGTYKTDDLSLAPTEEMHGQPPQPEPTFWRADTVSMDTNEFDMEISRSRETIDSQKQSGER